MIQRRSEVEQRVSMLKAIASSGGSGVRMTTIRMRARLNYEHMRQHMKSLVAMGMISRDMYMLYYLTPLGLETLGAFDRVKARLSL